MTYVKNMHNRACVCTQPAVFWQKTCVSEIICVTLHPIFKRMLESVHFLLTLNEKNHVRN